VDEEREPPPGPELPAKPESPGPESPAEPPKSGQPPDGSDKGAGRLPVWVEIVGVFAAIFVAVAAVAGLFYTAKALHETKKANTLSARALDALTGANALTARAVHISEEANARAAQSFEASIRPLITSVNPPVTRVNHHAMSCHRHHGAICLTKSQSGRWVWSIPIQNVGPGVALIKRIYATGRSAHSRRRGTVGTSEGVPSGEITRIRFDFRTQAEFRRYTVINIFYADIDSRQAQRERILVSPRDFLVKSET